MTTHSTFSPLSSEAARSTGPGGDTPPAGIERQPSVIGVVNTLLRHVRLIVILPVAIAALVVVAGLLRGPSYVATARFSPEGGSNDASRLLGLAAQFGVAIPRSSDRDSPEFYAALVTSEDLLRDAVLTHYTLTGDRPAGLPASPTLLDVYHPRADSPDEQVRRAVDALRKHVGVAIDTKANILTVTVNANRPDLAVAVNRRIIDLVSAFNLRKRQSRAAAERTFVEGRLADAQSELRAAESDLQSFLENNRQYRNSPQLSAEQDRLQRRVELRQQLYTSLAQSFEQARIEEVRNTPVVTLIDAPERSARRATRLSVQVILAFFPALVLAVALAFALEFLERERTTFPDEYARFATVRRALIHPRRARSTT